MKDRKFIMAVLIPICVYVSIFILLPILGSFGISFMQYNPLLDNNKFIGLTNFSRLLKDELFFKALTNTLVFVVITVTVNLILSLGISYFITTFKSNKLKSFFRAMFFLPCVAPMAASAVVWGKSIYPTRSGLANMIIDSIGGGKINWLGDPDILMISIIVFTIWADIGFNIILFGAGMDGIPDTFYEAAKVDGVNEWQKFRKITLPLLSRTFIFVSITTLISYFQMFAQFDIMVLKNGPQNAGLVLTSYIYKVAFEIKDMGYASAIAMVLFVIILIVTIIQQKLTKVDWEY